MGISYTIDSPLKVSRYGIDSVISIIDDILLEKIRKMYCGKYDLPYKEITTKAFDYRAKRITSYLNMIKSLAEEKFEEFKQFSVEKSSQMMEYFDLLPDGVALKKEFKELVSSHLKIKELKKWINDNLSMGSIDVNIMTKVDKANFEDGKQLPIEFNDAHSALRGYANSDLTSSVILSAGMNPRLYGYISHFEDFYPNKNGEIKKKIVLKVSDYRSALVQGKFLAKKGLWVSEYRIESGLNCGGHAFATEGYLLGPILEEFKTNKNELIDTIQEILNDSLAKENRVLPSSKLPLKISVQGGIGTNEEHNFLLENYGVDSVGWGSPFLLVPEATTVDNNTLNQLAEAKEKDLYLSNISPLGIPFNNLRNNTKDLEKAIFIEKGRPGSACPKKYLALNSEYKDKGICTASREYQYLKIKELNKAEISTETREKEMAKVIEKSCICVGLGTSSMIVNNIKRKSEGNAVSICPGPNMAYFSTKISLRTMVNHIYGRANVIERNDRPNVFIKELQLYLDYLLNEIEEIKLPVTKKQEKHLKSFVGNLKNSIVYYQNLFTNAPNKFVKIKADLISALEKNKNILELYSARIELKLQEKMN
jgi:hypothetical protein